jgi:hypothetical protein
VAGPFYNAETDSYFELFGRSKGNHRGWPWRKANEFANSKQYKGQRGRLALIRSHEILNFVRETFTISGASWIGARYYCKYSKLLWSDGKLESPKAPGMWHGQWHRTNVRCANRGYMPLYLTPPERGGIYWQASGPQKWFNYYLVEYPAPKKQKDASQKSDETTTPPQSATNQ